MEHCNSRLLSLLSSCTNSQENEGKQKSDRNSCYQQEGENHSDDDQGERDNKWKLQEHVNVKGKNTVHFFLIFGKPVENTARRSGVKEAHGAAYNLKGFANTFVTRYNLSFDVVMAAAALIQYPLKHRVVEFACSVQGHSGEEEDVNGSQNHSA